MSIVDLLRAYAEENNMSMLQVRQMHNQGAITPYELFEAYLRNEGIYGYTQQLVTAFRIAYNLDGINDQ